LKPPTILGKESRKWSPLLTCEVRDYGSRVAFATVDAVAEKDLAKRYVPSGNYPQLMWPLDQYLIMGAWCLGSPFASIPHVFLFLLTWPFWGRPKWCAGLSLFLQWVGRSPMVWTSILLSSTKDNQEISINKLQTSSNVSVFALFRTSINSQSFSKIPACLLSSAVQGSPMVSPRSTIARCARPRRWPTLF